MRRAPSRHLDRAAVGAIVRDVDGRIWGGTGVVYQPTDASSHVVTAGARTRVHVKLGTEELPLRCLMACLGVFRFPDVGDMVPVFVPGGDVSDERMGPVAFLGLTDQELPEGFDLRDVVLLARAGGKVRLGAATGTGPLAMAAATDTRLSAAEYLIEHHVHPQGVGFTGTAITGTVPNPPLGDPGHVLGVPDGDPIAGPPATPPGGAIAALAVEGI